jgi:hypothetical protein
MPSASAARAGVVVAFVKIRKPGAEPFIRSNNKAGQSGEPAATSVIPPISNFGSALVIRRKAPSLSTNVTNSRKSRYNTALIV